MKYFLHVFEILFKFTIWNILKHVSQQDRPQPQQSSDRGQGPNLPDWSSSGISSRSGLIPSLSKAFLIFASAIFDEFDFNFLGLN